MSNLFYFAMFFYQKVQLVFKGSLTSIGSKLNGIFVFRTIKVGFIERYTHICFIYWQYLYCNREGYPCGGYKFDKATT